jgi:hypothetical protein
MAYWTRIQEKIFVNEDAMGTIHITNRMINDSLSHDYPPKSILNLQLMKFLFTAFNTPLVQGLPLSNLYLTNLSPTSSILLQTARNSIIILLLIQRSIN